MGIRWYGWEITAEESQRAAADPWPVIREADKRCGDPSWAVTDFDKAWVGMQRLFSDPTRAGSFTPRPAYELVAGDVTYPNGYADGYDAYIGLIPARRVPVIARDLRTVTDADLRSYGEAWGPCDYREEVAYFLDVAREFADDVASRGHDVMYAIT
ncbi:MAG TPA: DUF1877 family protein [Steroidobacteraceae bacterium]